MKVRHHKAHQATLSIITITLLLVPVGATPLVSSWFTDLSGRYARIYEDNDAVANQTPVTTWNRGQGVQAEPVYAGVTAISYTETGRNEGVLSHQAQ